MPMEEPDTITVEVIRNEELAADRADLYVTVRGTSLFTGSEALKKAREVAQMVSELTEHGLPADAIFLEGVSAEVASGTVLKSSQATYRLRIHCAELEKLADTLGIIANQKNTMLRFVEWGYPDDEARRDGWLAACIARANAKAAVIAQGLGVTLLGVRSFSERYMDPETTDGQRRRAAIPGSGEWMGRARTKPLTQEDLGLEVSHTKTVEVSVKVEYRVSDFAE